MFPVCIIDQKARDLGLDYLVIGGHAVNVNAKPMDTQLLADVRAIFAPVKNLGHTEGLA